MFFVVRFLIFLDAIAALTSHLFGQYIRLGGQQSVSDIALLFGFQNVTYTGVLLLSGFFCELYTADRFVARTELAARIAVSIIIAFFVLAAFYYAAPAMGLGRDVLPLSLLAFGVVQYLLHRVFQFFQNFSYFARKIMIFGVGQLAEITQRIIPLSRTNYVFGGFIQPAQGTSTVPSDSIVGTVDQLEEILSREKVNTLVVSIAERRNSLPLRNLLTCKMRGVEIIDAPSFYEKLTGKLLLENIQPSWFIYSSGFRSTHTVMVWKRLMDVLHSVFGLLLFLPALPVVVLLIRLSSPGPIFFKQLRVGERGRNFTLLKFRTMYDNAEKESGPVWASKNDPRVTKVGSWLRKTRIDEIPQLLNVLKGEMSLIGPRPERKEFVDRLSEKIPYYGKRHFVKPGITGWAQVKYPYGASDEDALEKLRFDLYYIKNWSMTLDLIVVLETIKVVLFGRGGR